MKKFKFAIVLGGGGVRGLAHIGVLKILHNEGLIPSFIVGTSMGAVVGALYSATLNPEEIEKMARELIKSKEFSELRFEVLRGSHTAKLNIIEKFLHGVRKFFIYNMEFMRNSIITEELSRKIIERTIPYESFDELKIPFYAVSTCIVRGEPVIHNSGNLRKAVLASISIPGVFPPVRYNGRCLVDGASVSSTPVRIAKSLGADFVLGVEVRPRLRRMGVPKRGIDVIFRASDITAEILHEVEISKADFVLHPKVKNIHWANFKKYNFCIRKGEEEAKRYIKEIKKKIKTKKFSSFFKRIFMAHWQKVCQYKNT